MMCACSCPQLCDALCDAGAPSLATGSAATMHRHSSFLAAPFPRTPVFTSHGLGTPSADASPCLQHTHLPAAASARDHSEHTNRGCSIQCSTNLGESLNCSSLASFQTSRSGASGSWAAARPGQLHSQFDNALINSPAAPSSKGARPPYAAWRGDIAQQRHAPSQHSSRSVSSFGCSSVVSSATSTAHLEPRSGQFSWKHYSASASSTAGTAGQSQQYLRHSLSNVSS